MAQANAKNVKRKGSGKGIPDGKPGRPHAVPARGKPRTGVSARVNAKESKARAAQASVGSKPRKQKASGLGKSGVGGSHLAPGNEKRRNPPLRKPVRKAKIKPQKPGAVHKESDSNRPVKAGVSRVQKVAVVRTGKRVSRRSAAQKPASRRSRSRTRPETQPGLSPVKSSERARQGGAALNLPEAKPLSVPYAPGRMEIEPPKATIAASIPLIPPILLEGDHPVGPKIEPEKPAGTEVPDLVSLEKRSDLDAERAFPLPRAYGSGELFVAFCDPHCLHASWDFTPEQWKQCEDRAKEHKLWLRLFEGGNPTEPLLQEALGSNQRQLFVPIDDSAISYSVEIGFHDASGEWQSMASSASIEPPRALAAEDETARSSTLEYAEAVFTPALGFLETPAASENSTVLQPAKLSLSIEKPERGESLSMAPAETPVPERSIELEPCRERPREESMRSMPDQKPAEMQLEPMGESTRSPEHLWIESEVSGSVPAQLSEPTPPEALFEETPPQPGRELETVREDGTPGSIRTGPAADETESRPEWHPQEETPFREDSSPATGSEPTPLEGGIDSLNSADAGTSYGEAPGGISAPRQFWFNVHAELIVYGATEPDATVTLAGRRIDLRPDGTFSVRFALPDGNHQVEASALSSDGVDRRTARLKFQRSTDYWEEIAGKATAQESAQK